MFCCTDNSQASSVSVYWTVPSRRRQGLARGGLNLLSRWALGLPAVVRLEALVEPNNEGSIRVLEVRASDVRACYAPYLDLQTGRADALLYR